MRKMLVESYEVDVTFGNQFSYADLTLIPCWRGYMMRCGCSLFPGVIPACVRVMTFLRDLSGSRATRYAHSGITTEKSDVYHVTFDVICCLAALCWTS